MRFLFVYQDYADPARRLVDELAVLDVAIIVVRKNATSPNADELELLQNNKGVSSASRCTANA